MAKRLLKSAKAPDFELVDTRGSTIRLGETLKRGNVVLVLARGFM